MKTPPPLLQIVLIVCFSLLQAPQARATSTAREWNEQILAAIRINLPNPPGHARNLFHLAVGMYDAWAAYDSTAVGYAYNEKIASPPPAGPAREAARSEAISYAAYRILRARFVTPIPAPAGAAATSANIDNKLTSLGYSTAIAQAAINPSSTAPAELGKRIGQAILDWGSRDGFVLMENGVTLGSNYPQAYTSAVNPNVAAGNIMSVAGDSGFGIPNQPLGMGIPGGTYPLFTYPDPGTIQNFGNQTSTNPGQTDPNKWQPLAFSVSISQNGIIQGTTQSFTGVQGLATTPFSLTRTDNSKPWLDPFGGPSRVSVPGNPSATDSGYRAGVLDVLRYSSKLNSTTLMDTTPASPGHNNPLGADTGTGHPVNPVTGLPWAATPTVKVGDYGRVLAEFWADGPSSETPPGHWHVLANQISDDPALVKRIRGQGPVLGELEWDVKMYFALSGGTHDAACAAWSLKRYYSGTRPITMIRYLAMKLDLPLEAGVSEVITNATTLPGQRHEQIFDRLYGTMRPGTDYLGQIAVFSWPGEHLNNSVAPTYATPISPAPNQSLVTWMLARDWVPFQRKTFNTPPFPGYISGHSTFSRSAAEVLTLLTGSPYFPGGFGHHTFQPNTMFIDQGPSTAVDLQWASYYDAADQAGESRRWGGIHPFEDDYDGRKIGSMVGPQSFALAEKYWTGTIQDENMAPEITRLPNGHIKLNWQATRGMYHKVQISTDDMVSWTDVGAYALAYDTKGTMTDTSPPPGAKYYRIKRSTSP